MSVLQIPDLCLVVLVGASGSGKSTFAARHFTSTQVLSSDRFRALVADDENDQSATAAAFDALHHVAGLRLDRGLLTVVDATNVQQHARASLVTLAREHDVLPVAIVLDVPEQVAVARNAARTDRDFGAGVVRRHVSALRRSLRGLGREGFRTVHVLDGVEQVESASIERVPLRSDRRTEHGPFDVIGDVHGCLAELLALLDRLGYQVRRDQAGRAVDLVHPAGRLAVFVGDLVDRGPDSPGVLRLVMGAERAGHALVVPGNHEAKLVRALRGRDVQVSHGLETTLAQLAEQGPDMRAEVLAWADGLVAHLVLDDGRLVVAHAGLVEKYHNRSSGRVRSFALYGDTTGESDKYGLPVRLPWAQDYRGAATVLYGHTPTPEPEWVNNTLCLDTGVVFGGRLTALRYPERELVSVPAEQVWYAPARPFPAVAATRADDELRLTDVVGRRVVETAHLGRVTVPAENAAAALEVMSRFAQHPRWLPYLPPTMSPVATSGRPGLLEHPEDAFGYFADAGVQEVVCEEKHMGSRAVILVCRDAGVAARRFGADDGRTGSVSTRTGRAFAGREVTERLLARLRAALEVGGIWAELGTDWLLIDAELMPWSAKAEDLLREHYAAVGAAARAALPAAIGVLEQAAARGLDVADLLARTRRRTEGADAYTAVYRRYRWPTDGLVGLRLAPFGLLAGEGATFYARPHTWQLAVADRLVAADPELVTATRRLVVHTGVEASRAEGLAWWTALTEDGGEGMVVKPAAGLVRGPKGLVQPGLKVRGRQYLRLVYGPDYDVPANLDRLRERNLGRKRSLALREYALGLAALDRLVAGEPLWRVHEAVFAVLAMESEPVDPRL